ncbi:hypothetical protein LCGC14_1632860 [marine sediment metagenome]|uniref:Uncharacterized protein n=1 Tax=marine sediment metagenome TaxID=412755 RepID=A0A0F9I2D5_9ZZZZ
MNLDKLKETAEMASPAWWIERDLEIHDICEEDRPFIAAADPTTILALIELLEATENGLAYWEGIKADNSKLTTHLKAAAELIRDYEAALKAMTGGSTIRVYGVAFQSVGGERRRSVALTDDARKKLAAALAKHATYRERLPADE